MEVGNRPSTHESRNSSRVKRNRKRSLRRLRKRLLSSHPSVPLTSSLQKCEDVDLTGKSSDPTPPALDYCDLKWLNGFFLPTSSYHKSFFPSQSSAFNVGPYSSRIQGLCYSSSGRLLISSSSDCLFRVFHALEGDVSMTCQAGDWGCTHVKFVQGEDYIIHSAQNDTHLRTLSLSNQTYVERHSGHQDEITSISVCLSRSLYSTCSRDGTVKFWSPGYSGPLMYIPHLSPSNRFITAFDPNDLVLALVDNTCQLRLYDIRAMSQGPFARFPLSCFHSGEGYTSLEFTSDGKAILVGTEANSACFVDALNGQLLYTIDVPKPDTFDAPFITQKSKHLQISVAPFHMTTTKVEENEKKYCVARGEPSNGSQKCVSHPVSLWYGSRKFLETSIPFDEIHVSERQRIHPIDRPLGEIAQQTHVWCLWNPQYNQLCSATDNSVHLWLLNNKKS